jgi:ribosomal protein L11 methyltransferase
VPQLLIQLLPGHVRHLSVPYRIDLSHVSDDTFDRLVELGAIDAEVAQDGRIAALLPDSVTAEQVAHALGGADVTVSPAVGRDDESVWVLSRRPIHVGRLRIVPAHLDAEPGDLRLIDAAAFGSGLHPTTALCLEAIEEAVTSATPASMLDVGSGSGVLALAALILGVPRTLAIDIDETALRATAENARLNALDQRLQLARGGPEAVTGTWPLVVANVLAAPLIDMAPTLVRRVGSHGQLVLSGIPAGLEPDVAHAYRRLGMQRVRVKSLDGWIAIVMDASW